MLSANKEFVINTILKKKIIAIIRGIPKNQLIQTAEAMYDGGIRLMEITYSADGSVSDEETAAGIKMLSEHFKEKMLIGAGTVLTPEQVRLTKEACGTFIISPNVNEDVIKETCRLDMVSIPGALTPTEAAKAHDSGADFVKLFPVCSLGSEYVKAIKAPLSNIRFLAVGGIDENNLDEYLKAGVCGFGVGSNIAKKSLIDSGNYTEITALAKKYISAIKEG